METANKTSDWQFKMTYLSIAQIPLKANRKLRFLCAERKIRDRDFAFDSEIEELKNLIRRNDVELLTVRFTVEKLDDLKARIDEQYTKIKSEKMR